MHFSVGKNPAKIGQIRAQLKKTCYTVILVTDQQKSTHCAPVQMPQPNGIIFKNQMKANEAHKSE